VGGRVAADVEAFGLWVQTRLWRITFLVRMYCLAQFVEIWAVLGVNVLVNSSVT